MANNVTDPRALRIRELLDNWEVGNDVLGGRYSSARIAGGKLYRMSYSAYPLSRRIEAPTRYCRESFSAADREELAGAKYQILGYLAANGVDTTGITIEEHIRAILYLSVRVPIQE